MNGRSAVPYLVALTLMLTLILTGCVPKCQPAECHPEKTAERGRAECRPGAMPTVLCGVLSTLV